jgi:hypothetical protein
MALPLPSSMNCNLLRTCAQIPEMSIVYIFQLIPLSKLSTEKSHSVGPNRGQSSGL